jgi:hypothetical protein
MTHKNGPKEYRRLADKCRETARTVSAEKERGDLLGDGGNLGPYSRSRRAPPSLWRDRRTALCRRTIPAAVKSDSRSANS